MRPYTGQIPRKHFMGAVVLRGLVTSGLEYQAFEVIDGQQRLTTLQLLLLALRDYATAQSLNTVTALLTGMTENPPLNGREYERWKVVPTTRDRTDYGAIWEARSPARLLELCPKVPIPGRRRYAARPRLIETYEYFYSEIKEFAETNNHTDDTALLLPDFTETTRRVETLVRAITQQLELVRIDLDQDDDPQIIFETLNARGARLLPGDLVRNFLFLEATRKYQVQAEVEKLYSAYWQQYDDTESSAFWKAETAAEADGIVADLESYLVRRVICSLPSNSYNRIFLRMLTDLRLTEVINRQTVQDYLLNLSGPTAEWPTDEQFRHRWLTTRAYVGMTKPRIRMILEAVEWQQYTKFQESARPVLDSATIEHILPQTPTDEEWPLEVAPEADEAEREQAHLLRGDLMHSFGNLTLVTSPLNSWLSNSAFHVKEKELSSQSTLMLNRYFT
nr:hypothetical protein [Tanacetum cinerariifolium]